MEKQCKKCGQLKPIDNYNKQKSYCKPCQHEYTKEHNKKNYKKYYDKYTKIAVKKSWQRGQDFFDRYKGFCGCAKCKEKRHWLLDFHHIDPSTKQRPITYYKNGSMEVLKNEIKTCIVLCSNCHRDFHYQEKTQNINLKDYLKL